MTKPVSIPFAFATASGNVPASELDSDYQALAAAVNDLGTYSAFGAESGAVNAYVVTYTAGITVTLQNGLTASFNPLNTNTGASTINVGGTGVIALVRPDLTPLQPGDIASGSIYTAVYNQTVAQWVLSSIYFPQQALLLTQASTGKNSLPFIGSGTKPTIIQWGNGTVLTNSAGGGIVTFVTPFPNNCFVVVFGIGDNNINDLTIQAIEAQRTLSTQGFQAFAGGVGVNSQTIRVNYVAVGN